MEPTLGSQSYAQRVVEQSAQFWIDVFNLNFYQGILSSVAVAFSLVILIGYVCLLRQQAIFSQKLKRSQKDDVKVRKRDIFRHWVKGAVGIKEHRRKRRKSKLGSGVKRRLYDLAVGKSRDNALRKRKRAHTRSFLSATRAASLKHDVKETLQNIRVFGHFDDEVFQELFDAIEIEKRDKGQYLYRKNQPDNAIYIVQEGLIELVCVDEALAQHGVSRGAVVTTYCTGETVSSTMALIESLCGGHPIHETMESRAKEDNTVIIKITYAKFAAIMQKHHSAYRQFIQVACTHLQRATFVALRRFMGLSAELIQMPDNATTALCEHPEITQEDLEDVDRYNAKLEVVCAKMAEVVSCPGASSILSKVAKFSVQKKGATFITPGTRDNDLYYVVKGRAKLFVPEAEGGGSQESITVAEGHFAGELAILSGIESAILAQAETDCLLVRIPGRDVQAYLLHPDGCTLLNYLLRVVLSSISPLVHQVDYAFGYLYIEAGHVVYRQNEQSNDVYFVLSGRLRSVVTKSDGSRAMVREYGRYEVSGEVEVLTNSPRATSVHAVRDSELVKLPAGLLEVIKLKYMNVSSHLMRVVSKRLLSLVQGGSEDKCASGFSTVAFVPVSPDVPLSLFTKKIVEAISLYGTVAHVQSSDIEASFGSDFDSSRLVNSQLLSHLATIEDRHSTVIYEADATLTDWTRRCIRQADCIMLVAIGKSDPNLSILERQIEKLSTRSQKELVLLYPPNTDLPSETAQWLNRRSWCDAHHNIRTCASVMPPSDDTADQGFFDRLLDTSQLPAAVFRDDDDAFADDDEEEEDEDADADAADDSSGISVARQREVSGGVKDVGARRGRLRTESATDDEDEASSALDMSASEADFKFQDLVNADNPALGRSSGQALGGKRIRRLHRTHYARLARHLKGLSIGVVLGGGGAKGISHAGLLKMMELQGIPVDMVGGTSIGAFVGALYADEVGVKRTHFMQRMRSAAKRLGSKLNMILDLTYPKVAMFSGRAFNRVIKDSFEDVQIEDLWLPYFCTSTDISASKKRIHTHGSLWRYVRASMSLSGYLPPICDPEDGHLLLDGGYVDLLPIDVMRQRGAHSIFACEVSSKDRDDLLNYGDDVSGWWMLWRNWNPFLKKPFIPTMEDIASRLSFITSTNFLNQLIRNNDDIELITPPVEKYGVLEWDKFDEILQIGENFSKSQTIEFAKRWHQEVQSLQGSLAPQLDPVAAKYHHRSRLESVASMKQLQYEFDV